MEKLELKAPTAPKTLDEKIKDCFRIVESKMISNISSDDLAHFEKVLKMMNLNLQEENTNSIIITTEDVTSTENTESASSSIGKTVEESSEETTNTESNNENKVDANGNNSLDEVIN